MGELVQYKHTPDKRAIPCRFLYLSFTSQKDAPKDARLFLFFPLAFNRALEF